MLLGSRTGPERAQVAPFAGFWVRLARIQAISAGFEFPNHGVSAAPLRVAGYYQPRAGNECSDGQRPRQAKLARQARLPQVNLQGPFRSVGEMAAVFKEPTMTPRPDDLKANAEEYDRLADAAADPKAKKKFQDLARECRNLTKAARWHARAIDA